MKFGTWVRLAVQNFMPLGAGGGNATSKMAKNLHFLVEMPHRDEPFDRFLQLLEAFMRPTIPYKCFKCDMIHFTGYRVIAKKLHVGHLPEIFRAPCREKYALDQKNDCHLLKWSRRPLSPCKVWGGVNAKMWCLYVFFCLFFCHALSPVRGGYTLKGYCLWVDFDSICTVFRSNSKSRPNNIREGGKCPSVRRTYVRPSVHKKFLRFE